MELMISSTEGGASVVVLKKDALSLGRASDNDLAYPDDPWLSKHHLCFERTEEGWIVRDLGSRNGTSIDGENIKQRQIEPGNCIYAGHLKLEVRESSDTSKSVRFRSPDKSGAESSPTVVTNLDKVLGQTASRRGVSEDTKESALHSNRSIRALIRAGRELAKNRPLEELFQVILDLSLSAVEALRGVILTLDASGGLEVISTTGQDFTLSTTVRDRVLVNKESLLVNDPDSDAALKGAESIGLHSVHSFMAVPLQTGERVTGLLYVDMGDKLDPFSAEDLELLTVMANVAAIRIENARLAMIEQAEQRMEAELSQANEIQRNLLPSGPPNVPGYELAGFNLPCRTVGGDYFDFIPYEDGRLAVLVGDVSGKGLPASLMMSSLHARVHLLAESGPEPAPTLATLNRTICTHCPPGKFITFFYAVVDPANGKIRYANAGHNQPLMIRADGTSYCLLGSSRVLGITRDSRYEAYDSELHVGDTLAIFSDGVTEVRAPDGLEEYGEERLARFLLERQQTPTSDIISELVDYLRKWSGEPTFADDFTMLLMRRLA